MESSSTLHSNTVLANYANVWGSMGKSCSHVHDKTAFCTTSHARIRIKYYVTHAASERAMKPKVHRIKSLSP